MKKTEFCWRGPKNHRSAIDVDLCNSLKIDNFTLIRLRKVFAVSYQDLPYKDKADAKLLGVTYRIKFLTNIIKQNLSANDWNNFLTYINYTSNEVNQMCSGKICVSPFVVRTYSGFFGITPDFILIGNNPSVNHGSGPNGL